MKAVQLLASIALSVTSSMARTQDDPDRIHLSGMSLLADQVVQGVKHQGKVLASNALLGATAASVARLFPGQSFELLFIQDTTPNAKAFPNGKILLNQGLLLDLDTLSDWEFVVAHEVAHLALNHFQRRQQDNTAKSRERLEQEADTLALEKMTLAGKATDSIPALLSRTRTRQADSATTDQQQTPFRQPDSGLNTLIVDMQKTALEQQLLSNQLARAEAFLHRRGHLLDARDVLRWRWMISQRRMADNPGESQPLEFPMPAALAEKFPDGPKQCAALVGWAPRNSTEGLRTRFGALRFYRDKRWRVALQTGQQLILTPDRSALTRLDIWQPNTTPGTPVRRPAKNLACPNTRPALWHTLIEIRSMDPGRKLHLLDATATPQGVYLDFSMTDESGLGWKLRAWRIVHNGQVVFALFKAPAQHFFPRHLESATNTVGSLFGPA